MTGLGFAATCSLGWCSLVDLLHILTRIIWRHILEINRYFCAVCVDSEGEPVTVSLSGDARRNVIVWMDHRAVKQAERINLSNSPVLQYCGGSLSPEMQPPKVCKQIISESSFTLLYNESLISGYITYLELNKLNTDMLVCALKLLLEHV